MSAAKAALPDNAGLTALLGTVGTVPRKGLVWNRQAHEFSEFLAASAEALELIEGTMASSAVLNRPFPILAVESHDLSEVRGAYDILTLDPDDLPTSPEVTEEMIEVADVLRRATLAVRGSLNSVDFQIEVGMDGSSAGILQATVRMNGDDVCFTFGYAPGPNQQTRNQCALSSMHWRTTTCSPSTTTQGTSSPRMAYGIATQTQLPSRTGDSRTSLAST